ncbi:MAG: hypothetical protein Q4F81_05130 [Eubacteriales bacterium]|nr:hypothetical protein [Eubacteriales bacterium]
MYFIHGGRGSGKTTYLLKMSAATGIPILTANYCRRKLYEDYAKAMGLMIPKPIIYGDQKLMPMICKKVLIDNGEEVINHILRKEIDVSCDVMAIRSPVIHITNCFLDSQESLPSEVLGGKFESMDIEQAYQFGIWAERLKEE